MTREMDDFQRSKRERTQPRDIANGAQLPRFQGKNVAVFGVVQSMGPARNAFKIKTTDGVIVNVALEEELLATIGQWVEVRGIYSGSQIRAVGHSVFKNEEFDVNAHNELCNLLYSVNDLYRIN